jgi:hypothetical protein
MIKELMDHSADFRIRRSDIGLSSFGSYFKKIIKEVKTSKHVPSIETSDVKKMMNASHFKHNDDASMLLEPDESLMNHATKPKSSMSGMNPHDSKRSKSNINTRRQDFNVVVPNKETESLSPYDARNEVTSQAAVTDMKMRSHTSTFDPNGTGVVGLPPIFAAKVDGKNNAQLMSNQQIKVQKIHTQLRDGSNHDLRKKPAPLAVKYEGFGDVKPPKKSAR